MRELLEGRRAGFALRPLAAMTAVGLGIAVTLTDLMAWFAWGAPTTNGFTVVALWLTFATAAVALLGLLTAVAELIDVPEDAKGLARVDVATVGLAFVLYAASGALRSFEPGAAAPSPPPFLLATAGLIVLVAGGITSALLYASRVWEELDEYPTVHERSRRRA